MAWTLADYDIITNMIVIICWTIAILAQADALWLSWLIFRHFKVGVRAAFKPNAAFLVSVRAAFIPNDTFRFPSDFCCHSGAIGARSAHRQLTRTCDDHWYIDDLNGFLGLFFFVDLLIVDGLLIHDSKFFRGTSEFVTELINING